MKVATTIAATLGGIAAAFGADGVTLRSDLLDRGFKVIAEGPLAEVIRCQETEYTMRVIGSREPDPMFRNLCVGGVTKHGAFQRLKNDDSEFVCVSFRDWACYSSPAQK